MMNFPITKKLNHLCSEVVTDIVVWHLTIILSHLVNCAVEQAVSILALCGLKYVNIIQQCFTMLLTLCMLNIVKHCCIIVNIIQQCFTMLLTLCMLNCQNYKSKSYRCNWPTKFCIQESFQSSSLHIQFTRVVEMHCWFIRGKSAGSLFGLEKQSKDKTPSCINWYHWYFLFFCYWHSAWIIGN